MTKVALNDAHLCGLATGFALCARLFVFFNAAMGVSLCASLYTLTASPMHMHPQSLGLRPKP
jgi:hypothetical protein